MYHSFWYKYFECSYNQFFLYYFSILYLELGSQGSLKITLLDSGVCHTTSQVHKTVFTAFVVCNVKRQTTIIYNEKSFKQMQLFI